MIVAKVDVQDDTIRRFVVRHYRYDPQRHERRMESVRGDIEQRRSAGGPVDRQEHVVGVVYEPGDRRRAATGHLLRRMMEHGVDPRPWIDMFDLPSNIGFLSADGPPGPAMPRARRLGRRWLP